MFFSFSRGDRSSRLALERQLQYASLGRLASETVARTRTCPMFKDMIFPASDGKMTDDRCCNCMRVHCMKDDTKPTGHKKPRRE